MTEIEKEVENKGFLLKGIENVFLKFKGVKRPTPEELAITNAQLQAQQEKQNAIDEQARIEAENARQYQLLQEQLKKEQEAAKKQRIIEDQEKQNKLVNQADMFLDASLNDLYLTMCNNGYRPNKSQKQRFIEHINDIILNLKPDVDLNVIENYMNMGYKLSSSNTYHLLSQPYFQTKFFNKELFDLSDNDFSSSLYPKLFSNLKSNLKLDFFQEHLIKKMYFSFTEQPDFSIYGKNRRLVTNSHKVSGNVYEISNIPVFLDYMNHIILPKFPLEKFIEFVGLWNKREYGLKSLFSSQELTPLVKVKLQKKFGNNQSDCNSFYDNTNLLMKDILRNYYSEDLQQLLHNTKVISSETYVEEKVVKNTQTLSSNYKVNNLPENTKEIFHDLQKLYDRLEKHMIALNDDQKFLVENLFDKRIPEVLQKYFSIDEEYRTTLTNSEGKNAKDLMDESLINFKNKLAEVLENININKLSDLSVTKRYSKNI